MRFKTLIFLLTWFFQPLFAVSLSAKTYTGASSHERKIDSEKSRVIAHSLAWISELKERGIYIAKYSEDYSEIKKDLSARGKRGELYRMVANIRVTLTDSILAMLTTADGMIGSLFSGEDEMQKILKKCNISYAPDAGLKWDFLDPGKKRKVLRAISSLADDNHKNYIRGIKVRSKLKVNADKKLNIFGTGIKKGISEIYVENIFQGVKFYWSTDGISKDYMEFVVSGQMTAGEMINDVVKLSKILGIRSPLFSLFIVAPFPDEAFRLNPKRAGLELYYYSWRFNSIREMKKIVDGFKSKIDENREVDFIVINSNRLYGFKVNGIKKTENLKGLSELMDTVQYYLVNFPGLHSASQLEKWQSNISTKDNIKWYRDDRKRLKEGLPSVFSNSRKDTKKGGIGGEPINNQNKGKENVYGGAESRLFDITWQKQDIARLKKIYFNNPEVGLLVYNWLEVPIIKKDMALKKRILYYQRKALGRLKNGSEPFATVRRFIIDSGVLNILSVSMDKNIF